MNYKTTFSCLYHDEAILAKLHQSLTSFMFFGVLYMSFLFSFCFSVVFTER